MREWKKVQTRKTEDSKTESSLLDKPTLRICGGQRECIEGGRRSNKN